jgi:8-oxo-dGTP pyrophosphatase MutT (NUDIX family)
VRKVLAYIVSDGQVLVFRHSDHPEAGLQVPAGTVRNGESVEEAVVREAWEETGLADLNVVGFLGRYQVIAASPDEIQDRFVFQLGVAELPERDWVHHEMHDGLQAPTAFRFYWLPLRDPELAELVGEQGALLDRIEL